jgi:hypothetical protein
MTLAGCLRGGYRVGKSVFLLAMHMSKKVKKKHFLIPSTIFVLFAYCTLSLNSPRTKPTLLKQAKVYIKVVAFDPSEFFYLNCCKSE